MDNKKDFKIKIGFELAYELIFYSVIIILIGLAFLFASNTLAFNWYTLIFSLFTLLLLYLKKNSYLSIKKETMDIIIFNSIIKKSILLEEITEIVFYEAKRKIIITLTDKKQIIIYLNKKNKKIFLNKMMEDYSNISCFLTK